MRIKGARIEPGPTGVRLTYTTGFGEDRVRDLSDDEADLVMAGAVLMKLMIATKAADQGGVLFSEQVKTVQLPESI